ncbi:MAG: homogentisate 1,2-dioxygenase [Candidatus Dormibacteraeota bacterium]|nr:homogentisate 1,2-dioxygenase [Candidatus Dormibacteraeota bacterium]
MRPYRVLGNIPRKRHMRFQENGSPLYEELFGREGFSGPSSLLYHRFMPEAAHDLSEGTADAMTIDREQVHAQGHLKGSDLAIESDLVTGRQWLMVNDDIKIGLALPARQQEALYVNGSADEVLFVHEGSGTLHSQFGSLAFGRHDYLVIPRGTVYRIDLAEPKGTKVLCLEVTGFVDAPPRYRANNGQLTEFAPYSERDFRPPVQLDAGSGAAEVWLKFGGHITKYQRDQHPWDVVGWDGTIYPIAFNIHDFEPRAGRFHVPPPFHQTFNAHNVVICSFVPRKLDWDPDAVMLPYHHSNLDSDEVLYYVDGNYAARRGIKQGSFTHHVGGLPHGPQPGALEASFDRPRETDELAVMIDTFRPLQRTTLARQITDREYPFSWHTGGVRGTTSIA